LTSNLVPSGIQSAGSPVVFARKDTADLLRLIGKDE
jgi:hypothetical protein